MNVNSLIKNASILMWPTANFAMKVVLNARSVLLNLALTLIGDLVLVNALIVIKNDFFIDQRYL